MALVKGVRIGKGLKPLVSRDFNTIISLSVAITNTNRNSRTLSPMDEGWDTSIREFVLTNYLFGKLWDMAI